MGGWEALEPNKKMGVNTWEWDTCPIQEHFKNIKLIGETLFPWVWPDRETKRKKKEKGEEKWYLLGLVPYHFASNIPRFVAKE